MKKGKNKGRKECRKERWNEENYEARRGVNKGNKRKGGSNEGRRNERRKKE